jgi:nicotinamidase-related amidase
MMLRSVRALRLPAIVSVTLVAMDLAVAMCGAGEPDRARTPVRLEVRSLSPADGHQPGEKLEPRELVPAETAIVICDVWDKHWCAGATGRCDVLARKIAVLVDQARARGMHIVHAPSDTLDFYREHPARLKARQVAFSKPPVPIDRGCGLDPKREDALPIDDSDGGCDCQPPCPDVNKKYWSRQHPAITIDEGDLISDNGQEIYNYFVQEKINNVIYVGVHTNMCVLGRSFGIRQMTRQGFHTLLVRDLTDSM